MCEAFHRARTLVTWLTVCLPVCLSVCFAYLSVGLSVQCSLSSPSPLSLHPPPPPFHPSVNTGIPVDRYWCRVSLYWFLRSMQIYNCIPVPRRPILVSCRPINMGGSGGVVHSLDFCLALLKSLGCFYFRCILHNGRRWQ